MDDSDWKLKRTMGNVPIVYLNTALDFSAWHVAFRRLVVGYNMTEALMYSIPLNQVDSMKQRAGQTAEKLGQEKEKERKLKSEEKKNL